jgi:serine/threonine protein kinase
MERPQWDLIQQVFYSALGKTRSQRSAYVANACGHDPDFERKINSLLKADESVGGFLESPVFEFGLQIIGADNASREEELIGKTVGHRYLVEAKLGSGGIGRVYLAHDLELHPKRVVIKVLSEAMLKEAYVVKKFNQEIEALARMDHPNVVDVLDSGKLPDGKPYIVMQYVPGVTLRSQITSEGMNLERAATILKQIGVALDHAHKRGIFHRDLKPENIMLQTLDDGTDFVKVVDFGIAKVKDSVVAPSTVDNVPLGTVMYMSPEQLRAEPNITAASDIFCLAVTAHEMVTGRRPFNPASSPELLELQRRGVLVKPSALRPNLSAAAEAEILRSLSFEPAKRSRTAGEFAGRLAQALIDGRFQSGREGRFQFGTRRTAIGGLVAVFIAALLGVYLINRKDGPVTPAPTRSFTYSLTVQKMRDGKPYQSPFQSNGDETFENGDSFRLNVSSEHRGYLYLFNEGPPAPDGSSFTIVYPTPSINNGSAMLGASQPVESNWFTFKGPPGTENFWLVWSSSPVNELEDAKTEAFKTGNSLPYETTVAIRSFLETKESEIKPRMMRFKRTQTATVRGPSELLVKHVQFAHR